MQCLQAYEESILKFEKIMWKELDIDLNGNEVRRRQACLRKAMTKKGLASYWDEFERAKSHIGVCTLKITEIAMSL